MGVGVTFTNPYQPFQPGAVKVFRGRKSGAPSVIVDLYLTGTRTFRVGTADVPTRILQETEFEDGDVAEISGDPADAGNAALPAVFMPENPQVGSTFKPEDLFPIVDETDEVKAVGLRVGVPAGRFAGSIRVVETTRLGDKPETKMVRRRRGRREGQDARRVVRPGLLDDSPALGRHRGRGARGRADPARPHPRPARSHRPPS